MPNKVGFELSGMDELKDLIKDMEITDEKAKAAMKKALQPIKNEVQNSSPYRTGDLKKSVTTSVKKEGLGVSGKVQVGEFYGGFLEYGTSKSKKHVGFFSRSINKTKDDVVKILADELMK